MVYSSKFVLCVLVNGQPQTERADGIVTIPYGSSYTLRCRNKNYRRAVVKIYIDGENVSGSGYVIGANNSVDIERHASHDAAFQFVPLDGPEAVDAGKNGPNTDGKMGVIEARFYLEKEYKPIYEIHHHHYPKPEPVDPWKWPTQPYKPWQPIWYNTPSVTCTAPEQTSILSNSCSAEIQSILNISKPLQEGCTVEGGTTGQRFGSVWIDVEQDFVTLKLVLRGNGDVQVAAQKSEYCVRCGSKRSRKSDKFCGQCGLKL